MMFESLPGPSSAFSVPSVVNVFFGEVRRFPRGERPGTGMDERRRPPNAPEYAPELLDFSPIGSEDAPLQSEFAPDESEHAPARSETAPTGSEHAPDAPERGRNGTLGGAKNTRAPPPTPIDPLT